MANNSYEIVRCTDETWYVCDWQCKIVAQCPSHFTAVRHVRTLQGLPTCHDLLVDQGVYTWTHHDADFWDDGDGESGPMIHGHGPFDEYVSECEYLYFEDGVLAHREKRDMAREKWEEENCSWQVSEDDGSFPRLDREEGMRR